MSASSFEHPSLRTPVTTEQRDRAEQHLQAAYAEGRISEQEFDRRIEQVLSASTRKELNEAFYGLVEAPTYSPSSFDQGSYDQTSYGQGSYSAMQPYGHQRHPANQQQGTPGGALAHFSGLFTSILGPGIGYAVSPQGSPARQEAAKAFNFQLISLIALVIAGTVGAVVDIGLVNFLIGLGWLAWVTLSIVGGVKAAQGGNWTNPVSKAVKLKVLPEK
jgi:uncharacterized Tic20 family protein